MGGHQAWAYNPGSVHDNPDMPPTTGWEAPKRGAGSRVVGLSCDLLISDAGRKSWMDLLESKNYEEGGHHWIWGNWMILNSGGHHFAFALVMSKWPLQHRHLCLSKRWEVTMWSAWQTKVDLVGTFGLKKNVHKTRGTVGHPRSSQLRSFFIENSGWDEYWLNLPPTSSCNT